MPQTRHYEMKDSGVEWIGKMPKDWDIVRFKRMHRGSNVGPSLDKDYWSTNEEDTIFYTAGFKSIHTSCKDIVPEMLTKENDLLLARNGTPYVYFPCVGAIYTDHIIRVGIENGYNKAFVRYCLQQSIANEVVDTVSIATWSVPIWNRQCLPHPPLPEQTAIATYLDEKCATIDAIIAEAKASIEEYKSWKASVIFETVTKGLNPNAEMKDSGVEWIGEIPKGWNLMPFGKIASIKACLVPPKEYPLLPQISPDNIEKGSARLLQNYKTVQESGVISWNHHFYKGQIIYSKVRPTLNKLFLAQFEGLCSADMYPIETTQDARYLVYAMLSGYFVQQVAAITANRVKMPKINKQELSKITVLLPPLSEQASIVSYLDRKCSLIDGIILEKEELIRELEHYKRSLIFEVVTGKRRVC